MSEFASHNDPLEGELKAGDPDDQESPAADPDSDEFAESQPNKYLDDLQRLSAEFANYRKQTDRRNAELARQAGSRLALQLLPVLDAIDAAVQLGVDGAEPIRDQLFNVLEGEGLEQIAGLDEEFDPSRHEATMTEPADDDQETSIVSEVFRSGYAWNGRVLRAAMVKVKG